MFLKNYIALAIVSHHFFTVHFRIFCTPLGSKQFTAQIIGIIIDYKNSYRLVIALQIINIFIDYIYSFRLYLQFQIISTVIDYIYSFRLFLQLKIICQFTVYKFTGSTNSIGCYFFYIGIQPKFSLKPVLSLIEIQPKVSLTHTISNQYPTKVLSLTLTIPY